MSVCESQIWLNVPHTTVQQRKNAVWSNEIVPSQNYFWKLNCLIRKKICESAAFFRVERKIIRFIFSVKKYYLSFLSTWGNITWCNNTKWLLSWALLALGVKSVILIHFIGQVPLDEFLILTHMKVSEMTNLIHIGLLNI